MATANTAGPAILIVSLVLYISLKSMWNLLNVVQVVIYLRLISDWPANSMKIMKALHNANTLQPYLDKFNKFTEKYREVEQEEYTQEELERVGVHDPNLFWSLGIFAIAIVVLLFLLLVYFFFKVMSTKFPKLRAAEIILGKKLFYNAWIRYLIESNLKITHNAIFVMHLKASFESKSKTIATSFNILLLAIIVLWPFFLTIFLLVNRDRLEDKRF